ncbi:hypothetical protein F2Q70_00011072 [Brassica cretica]|uniref:Uncharacterized protein n=1 Tax=Brassica cretica TaxID=69181 RepID=A0A8S9M400_BRACR|nr:hypothetical protein F2Q70_00011072 [Brassica cretica]
MVTTGNSRCERGKDPEKKEIGKEEETERKSREKKREKKGGLSSMHNPSVTPIEDEKEREREYTELLFRNEETEREVVYLEIFLLVSSAQSLLRHLMKQI